MKLKLAGLYADFTGDYGVLTFKKGLSTTEVSALDGRRMATLLPCLTEDGQDPLDHSVNWDGVGILISVPPEFTKLTTVAEQNRIDAQTAAIDAEVAVIVQPAHTRENLEVIADKFGISGIREISEPLGLKGTSIRGLIDQILSGKTVVDDTMPNQDVTTKV